MCMRESSLYVYASYSSVYAFITNIRCIGIDFILVCTCISYMYIYIYIYAFSRRFYPKRLTVHSGYTFIGQYMCSLGIEPTTFALLTQCSNH